MKVSVAAACLLLVTTAEAATVDDLAWMQGAWIQDGDGGTVEEMWTAPRGGTMGGVSRTVYKDGKVLLEFMKITSEPSGVTFTAIIAGQEPTPFVLLQGEPGVAVFENKAHDFPQRVIYRRCDADLCARIEGTIEGQEESQDWRYRRLP